MSIKNRIKKIEAVSSSRTATGERHGITLDQWRRLAAGIDVLPEIPESKRPTFFRWREHSEARQREAAATTKMFAD